MAAATDTDLLVLATVPAEGFRQATADDLTAWANDNGFTVSTGRGRKPLAAVHAFNKAHRRRKIQYVVGSESQPEREYTYTTAKGRKGKFRARPQDVRAWAAENGLTVGQRGRFSAEVLDAYGQALRSR